MRWFYFHNNHQWRSPSSLKGHLSQSEDEGYYGGGGVREGVLSSEVLVSTPPLSFSLSFSPFTTVFFTKRWADTSDFFILRGHNYLPMSPHPFGIQNSCPKYCSHLNINNMPTPYSVHDCFGVSKLPARTQSGMRPGERCPRI